MIKIFLYEICFWKPIIITSIMAKSILPINQKRTSFLMKHYHFYNWKMFLCINSLKSRPKQLPVVAVPRHCSRKLKSYFPPCWEAHQKQKPGQENISRCREISPCSFSIEPLFKDIPPSAPSPSTPSTFR